MKKTVFGLVVVLVLMCSLAFAAPGTIKLKVLGRAPLSKPVLQAEAARQAIKDNIEEIRKLQGDEFILDLADQMDKLVFREESIAVGERMEWMLFRDSAKRVRNIKNVEWAGEAPFKAFGFEAVHAGKIYHLFVVQKCGNIVLYHIRQSPPPIIPALKNPEPEKTSVSVPAEPVSPAATPTPIPVPAKRRHDNFKLKFGYAPNQIDVLGPDFNLNEERTLQDYLPASSYFYSCENDDAGWLYTLERYLNFVQGDRFWLKKGGTASLRQFGLAFTGGLEFRLWKSLWVSTDYFQSRKIQLGIQETFKDMGVEQLEYLGYYPSSETYVHYMKLSQRIVDHQATVTAFSRELDLTLKWVLQTGRVSLAPFVGIACQQFVQEQKDDTLISLLQHHYGGETSSSQIHSSCCPGETTTSSETHSQGKFRHYDYSVVAGISGELRLLGPVALGADVSYRKFPDQAMHFQSQFDGRNWSFRPDSLRVAVSLKLVI